MPTKKPLVQTIRRILIDIEENGDLDVSFQFGDSGEIFGADEFKGKIRKELEAIRSKLMLVLQK